MMRRISSVLLLSSAFSFSSHASFAQSAVDAPKPPSDAVKAQAAQRFDRGLSLFNEGDNAGALAEFKQTYALMPNTVVLYNIGLVYAAMMRPVDAVDALTNVVDAQALSPEQRERAQKTLADQRARIGRIAVTTLPEGARIDVDGVEVARTPLNGPLRVAEGNHVIGAVAEGYSPARKEILVAGNADASVSFELVLAQAKRLGNLTIRSRIGDAEVLIDGKPAGKTPLTTSLALPSGVHTVELRRAGYESRQQQVELGEGATGQVRLDLAADPDALRTEGADFVIEAREPNIDVTVDDEHLGIYSQPLRLPKGNHHVRLRVAGYLPFERDINLEAAKSFVLRPFLLPTPETRAAHDSNVRFHQTFGWIGVGLGAALIGGGATWLAVNSSKKSDKQAAYDAIVSDLNNDVGICNSSGGADVDACNAAVQDAKSELDSAKSKDIVGYVGLGAGVAFATTGVVLLLTGESSHRFDPPASAGRAKRSNWALMPGPGQLGLGLGASF